MGSNNTDALHKHKKTFTNFRNGSRKEAILARNIDASSDSYLPQPRGSEY